MLCSRAFRSSALSSTPPLRHGLEDGTRCCAVKPCNRRSSSAGFRGKFQRAGAVRESDLDGVGLVASAGGTRRAGTEPELHIRGRITFLGGSMRDPELVARAQHAAARLESAWERWRALQGLGETPAQPVVGYVGYALREPWGQPRAVIGFSAEEAERLAEFLEHSTTDSALEVAQRQVPNQPNQPNQQPAPSPPVAAAGKRSGAGGKQTAASRAAASAASPAVAAPAAPPPPAPPASAPVAAAPAANPEALAVTSQLPGSQRRHSFLPGISARLKSTGAVSAAPVTIVWTRDGQAPARVQTFSCPRFS